LAARVLRAAFFIEGASGYLLRATEQANHVAMRQNYVRRTNFS
jgi:hypothetical protein